MISTEKVFDLLPYAVDLYEKLDLDQFKKNLNSEDKSKEEIGIEVFLFVLRQSQKFKGELFQMVAILNDKTVDEIKAQPFTDTIKAFKAIFSEPDIADFFKQAVQSAMPKL